MPTVMAYHDVKDKDHWLASQKARSSSALSAMSTNIRTFVDPENATRVGLVMDVADMNAVMAAMETEAAADAMAHDGVLPETLVILVEPNPLSSSIAPRWDVSSSLANRTHAAVGEIRACARTAAATSAPRTEVPEAVRVQILATEHWSLLATRSITYGAIYSRATIFLTVVIRGRRCVGPCCRGDRVRRPFLRVRTPRSCRLRSSSGAGTYVRLVDARIEDFWLQSGLNRLRPAYLEISPELEPYFVTGHHDDQRGLSETYGPGTEPGHPPDCQHVHGRPGVIDAVLAGSSGASSQRSWAQDPS